jgi:hypothetical protein
MIKEKFMSRDDRDAEYGSRALSRPKDRAVRAHIDGQYFWLFVKQKSVNAIHSSKPIKGNP